jgi:hypothetical protein
LAETEAIERAEAECVADADDVNGSKPIWSFSGDFEAAARGLTTLAALLYGHADNFRKKRFSYQTSLRVMGGDCREGATIPINKSISLAFLKGGIAV